MIASLSDSLILSTRNSTKPAKTMCVDAILTVPGERSFDEPHQDAEQWEKEKNKTAS